MLKHNWFLFESNKSILATGIHHTGRRLPKRELKCTESSSCNLSQKTFNRSFNEDTSLDSSCSERLQHITNRFTSLMHRCTITTYLPTPHPFSGISHRSSHKFTLLIMYLHYVYIFTI